LRRLLRNIALGKKNWLFIGHEDSRKIHSLFYSLVLSAILNGINPRLYLHNLLSKVHDLRRGIIDSELLLPHTIDQTDLKKFADELLADAKKYPPKNTTLTYFYDLNILLPQYKPMRYKMMNQTGVNQPIEKIHDIKKLNWKGKRAICEQWKLSGKSKAQFCKEQRLSLQTFWGWCDRLWPRLNKKGRDLAPVRIINKNDLIKNTSQATLEISLPNQSLIHCKLSIKQLALFIQELSHATSTIRKANLDL
jgi:hypothetical protein